MESIFFKAGKNNIQEAGKECNDSMHKTNIQLVSPAARKERPPEMGNGASATFLED